MRALLIIVTACAVPPPASPAAVTAPPGRLAGAPEALRANAVSYPDLPAARPAAEHHHHHPQ